MTQTTLKRLGRYEILEVIGQGAMGVVYKAQDSFLDRIVAVKTYRQDTVLDDDLKRRFQREVKTASKLAHPNIVTVYDGGLEGEMPFLAMEYVEGSTLAAELKEEGRLPVERALRILMQVAEGLAYAHRQGVVHRDLKPANVLIATGGQPKIADFGVAKIISGETQATLTPVGTPSYMSPEQAMGRPIDARADVFAFAILAYELLTGVRPFEGDSWTAVLFRIMNEDPPPPSDIAPDLPPAVDGVIGRGLAKDPAHRTTDVATLARELRAVFVPEREETRASRSDDELSLSLDLDTGDLEPFRRLVQPREQAPARPGHALGITAGAVAALLLLLVIVLVARRQQSEAPAPEPEEPIASATEPAAPTQPRARATLAAPPTQPQVARAVAPTPRPAATLPAAPAPQRAAAEPTIAMRPTAPAPPREAPRPTEPAPPVARVPTPPLEMAKPAPTRPLAPASVPLEAALTAPSMDVITTPPGADVRVGGVSKGRTPLRLADLAPGHYDFEIRKEGYSPYRTTADLEEKAHYELKVTLVSELGSLSVRSQPDGADVTINGDARGRAPLKLPLPAGRYEVAGSLEGYPTKTMSVALEPGETREVFFRFWIEGAGDDGGKTR